MYRSGRARGGRRELVLGLAVLMAGAVATQPGLAAAEGTAPVIDIVAPVLDIQFGDADLKSEAKVEQGPAKTKITLDSTVLFGKDSAKINSRAKGRISQVAKQLKGRGPGTVKITGYTDDLGSAAHGKTLSRQRAKAVAGLLAKDLPGNDYPITTVGKGEDDPAAPNTSEKNRRINRRVVVVYTRR